MNTTNGYLTSPTAIARYLCETIRLAGFYVRCNQSDYSESMYLNINLGTREQPVTLHVRISNHAAPKSNKAVRYDYDICGAYVRQGATTYVKVLLQLARQYGMSLPAELRRLQPGTPQYKDYAIRMQRRAVA